MKIEITNENGIKKINDRELNQIINNINFDCVKSDVLSNIFNNADNLETLKEQFKLLKKNKDAPVEIILYIMNLLDFSLSEARDYYDDQIAID